MEQQKRQTRGGGGGGDGAAVETFDQWYARQLTRAGWKRRWANRNARRGRTEIERLILTDEPALDADLAAQLAAWRKGED
jgi:hypothetical protein